MRDSSKHLIGRVGVSKKIAAALVLVALMLPVTGAPLVVAQGDSNASLRIGPYIDHVVYKVINGADLRILALQDDEFDMDLDYIPPLPQSVLQFGSEITVHNIPENGYGQLTINCDRYPLNISGFRRAFAFAYDKTRVKSEAFQGYCIVSDSLVPVVSDWCIEEDFDWHYYTNQSDIGNQILDSLNFSIDPDTGYRLAPDGTPFDIVIESLPGCTVLGVVTEVGVDALHSLHINATWAEINYEDVINRVVTQGDFDIFFYGFLHNDSDIRWLAYEFGSEFGDGPFQNPGKFSNATFDSWCDQLLNGKTYEEVFEAAAKMQRILQYNVPRLVVYTDVYLQGYKTDVFAGWVPDTIGDITGPWTMRNIHRIDGQYGGTVIVAIDQPPDTFNIFVSDSKYTRAMLDEMYSSLYDYGPDRNPVKDLADSFSIETNDSNPSVPAGHIRYIVNIIHNATWNDGTSLTAEDVAFTFNYMLDVNQTLFFPNTEMFGVWSPTPFQVVFEYSKESYWNFQEFAYTWIIPKHVFNDETGIGAEGWSSWNPVFNSTDPLVTSGPFLFADFEEGVSYELNYNPNFYYAPDRTLSTTTEPSTSNTTPTTEGGFPLWIVYISGGVTTGVILLIVLGLIMRRRASNSGQLY
ncbi:MAG: hypothetical protein EAX87_02305 [Candidatus Thorarchaeota archaeon]|nr:hypothetical protein [Candidatus Thorarchaeota archaeon]